MGDDTKKTLCDTCQFYGVCLLDECRSNKRKENAWRGMIDSMVVASFLLGGLLASIHIYDRVALLLASLGLIGGTA